MANHSSQLAEFLRLYFRLKSYSKRIFTLAAAASLLLTFTWYMLYRPTYVSEAIALVRPQQPAQPESTATTAIMVRLFPKPLGVADYTLLMKADDIIGAVAAKYNQQFPAAKPSEEMSVASLRERLSAVSRLEIKTPYTVNYYPTIELRVTAHSPESAYQLMVLWTNVIKERAHEIAFSTKEDVSHYLESEYQKEREVMRSLQEQLNTVVSESAAAVESLRIDRAKVEEQYEVATIALLNQAHREWDGKIADRESKLNLPLVNAQVNAVTAQLNELRYEVTEKQQALAEARARLGGLCSELKLYQYSPVADPGTELHWLVQVDSAALTPTADSIEGVEVSSSGANPVGVLLSRDASHAKVAISSLPQEIEGLAAKCTELCQQVDDLQTRYVMGDIELVHLKRERDATSQALQTERNYGLKNAQRESELLITNLTRQQQAMEDQLRRDLETKSRVFESLAKNTLEARLALANTMDDFHIITGPSRPEDRATVHVISVGALTFLSSLLIVSGAYIACFVLDDIIREFGIS